MVEPSLTSQIYRTIKHHILKHYHLKNVLCHTYVDVVTVVIVVSYCFTEACFHFIQLLVTVMVTVHYTISQPTYLCSFVL